MDSMPQWSSAAEQAFGFHIKWSRPPAPAAYLRHFIASVCQHVSVRSGHKRAVQHGGASSDKLRVFGEARGCGARRNAWGDGATSQLLRCWNVCKCNTEPCFTALRACRRTSSRVPPGRTATSPGTARATTTALAAAETPAPPQATPTSTSPGYAGLAHEGPAPLENERHTYRSGGGGGSDGSGRGTAACFAQCCIGPPAMMLAGRVANAVVCGRPAETQGAEAHVAMLHKTEQLHFHPACTLGGCIVCACTDMAGHSPSCPLPILRCQVAETSDT